MKIAILGFDREGKATYDFFKDQGHELVICDQNVELTIPEGVKSQLGDEYLNNLDSFDLVVRTPGLHPARILEKNPGIVDKITTGTNLFFENCPTVNIIGITGTKGKGTTSTLIAKILEADGRDVKLGGNIGVPMLSFINELTAGSWVVLEMSNFQLIDFKYSPHIATVLMIAPEHLNWHEDFEEYIAAKQQLFIHQNSQDIAIYYSKNDDSLSVADASEGKLTPYYEIPGAIIKGDSVVMHNQEICKTSELKLLGAHNWQNVCAAITTAWQVTQNIDAIRSVLTSFNGLEHRLEFVRELNDVKYYDDSFGTTPETAIVAIEAFNEPKIVILGGSDKGSSYEKLAETVVKNNVKHVIAIGDTGQSILDQINNVKGGSSVKSILLGTNTTMKEIVETAQKLSAPGDVVLLSTGCASFGLFNDYKDRGQQFTDRVNQLS